MNEKKLNVIDNKIDKRLLKTKFKTGKNMLLCNEPIDKDYLGGGCALCRKYRCSECPAYRDKICTNDLDFDYLYWKISSAFRRWETEEYIRLIEILFKWIDETEL